MADRVGFGIVGTGFIAQVHIDALRSLDGAEVRAVYGRRPERAAELSTANNIPAAYDDYGSMLDDPSVDAVVICLPNYQHAEFSIRAMDAGKHVICEKPLAMNLEEAAAMVQKARNNGLILGYAEELVFVPKFLRAMELASKGIGRVYEIRQVEKHDGPYSPWFFRPETAGGGIAMDMGCHSMEMVRFAKEKQDIQWVQAWMDTFLHGDVTPMEDHMIVLMGFADGTIGRAESSWALRGGMDSLLEFYGTRGVVYADLLKGMGLRAYSMDGFPNMWEPNKGWVYPDYEWIRNNGYPQEDAHFLDSIRSGNTPTENGKDGFAILELLYAAYHSAATGQRVYLPFRPANIPYAVDLLLNPRPELGNGRIDEVNI